MTSRAAHLCDPVAIAAQPDGGDDGDGWWVLAGGESMCNRRATDSPTDCDLLDATRRAIGHLPLLPLGDM